MKAKNCLQTIFFNYLSCLFYFYSFPNFKLCGDSRGTKKYAEHTFMKRVLNLTLGQLINSPEQCNSECILKKTSFMRCSVTAVVINTFKKMYTLCSCFEGSQCEHNLRICKVLWQRYHLISVKKNQYFLILP